MRELKQKFVNEDLADEELSDFNKQHEKYLNKVLLYGKDNEKVIVLKITPISVYYMKLSDGIVRKNVYSTEHYDMLNGHYSRYFLNNFKDEHISLSEEDLKYLKGLEYSADNIIRNNNLRKINSEIGLIDTQIYQLDTVKENTKAIFSNQEILNIKSVIENYFSKKKVKDKLSKYAIYAAIKTEIVRSSYGPGPISTSTVATPGWSISFNQDGVEAISGIKSKHIDEKMFSYIVDYQNYKWFDKYENLSKLNKLYQILKDKDILKIVLYCKSDYKEYGEDIFEIKDNCLYIYTVGDSLLLSEFENFKGTVNDHAYDPSAWGWT